VAKHIAQFEDRMREVFKTGAAATDMEIPDSSPRMTRQAARVAALSTGIGAVLFPDDHCWKENRKEVLTMNIPWMNRRTFITGAAVTIAGWRISPGAFAAGLAPFNITITHYPDQDYALPVVVAQELGYMASEGIEVKSIVGSSGGGTTVRNISQGGLLMGETASSAAIKAILAGENLKILAAGVQSPGTICWVVKKDSPIRTIRELAGKRIGFTQPGSVSEALLHMCLSVAGVDVSGVQFKAAGGIGENLTLLDTNGLDCAFTVDPVLTRYESKLRVVFFAREFVPRYLQTVWIASPGVIRALQEKTAGFLRARARGVDFTVRNPKEAARIFAKVTQLSLDAISTTLEHEKPAEYFSRGRLDPKALALVVDGMRIGKLLGPEKVPLVKIVDESALPASDRTEIPAEV